MIKIAKTKYETFKSSIPIKHYEYAGSDVFLIPFDYLSKSHVEVLINGIPTNNFEWLSTYEIHILDTLRDGYNIIIQRRTPVDKPIVDWTDGSILMSADLNIQNLQFLFALQESGRILIIEDDLNAAEQKLESMSVEIGQNRAAINEEKYIRATADEALAEHTETLYAQTEANKARIDKESKVRTDALEAVGTEIDNIKLDNNDIKATIRDEKEARITADESLIKQLNSLESSTGNMTSGQIDTAINDITHALNDDESMSAIRTESTTRVANERAEAKRVDTLVAKVGANMSAAIQKVEEASASRDESIAREQKKIIATVDSNSEAVKQNERNIAQIEEDTKALANADEVLAKQLQTVMVKTNVVTGEKNTDLTGSINDILHALDADESLAGIQTDREAIAITDKTNKEALKEANDKFSYEIDETKHVIARETKVLATKYEENKAVITEHAASIDGIKASWGLNVDVNGRVTGMKMVGTDKTSDITFTTDSFKIGQQGAEPVFEIGIVDGEQRIALRNAYLNDASVGTNKIVNGAVTSLLCEVRENTLAGEGALGGNGMGTSVVQKINEVNVECARNTTIHFWWSGYFYNHELDAYIDAYVASSATGPRTKLFRAFISGRGWESHGSSPSIMGAYKPTYDGKVWLSTDLVLSNKDNSWGNSSLRRRTLVAESFKR